MILNHVNETISGKFNMDIRIDYFRMANGYNRLYGSESLIIKGVKENKS